MLFGAASTIAMSEHPDSFRLDLDTLEIKETGSFPKHFKSGGKRIKFLDQKQKCFCVY